MAKIEYAINNPLFPLKDCTLKAKRTHESYDK
jgi:chromosome condensin MukBEF MukE localization factor